MLHELASDSAPSPEKKPRTDTDFIELARKRHIELLRQSLHGSLEETAPTEPLLMLYATHAIDHEKMNPQPKEMLRKRTYGKSLIDLGAGNGIGVETIKYFGFKPYVGVDLMADRLPISRGRMIKDDALTILLKIPDSYTNVMANGFLCKDWFPSGMEGYALHTLNQIRRVLPRNGGVFITSHFEFRDEALTVGLRVNEELSKLRSNITVFERGPLPTRK